MSCELRSEGLGLRNEALAAIKFDAFQQPSNLMPLWHRTCVIKAHVPLSIKKIFIKVEHKYGTEHVGNKSGCLWPKGSEAVL